MSTKQYEIKVYPEHGQLFKVIVLGVSAGEAARAARAQFPDAKSKSITAPQEIQWGVKGGEFIKFQVDCIVCGNM